jgi:hypothetical protein
MRRECIESVIELAAFEVGQPPFQLQRATPAAMFEVDVSGEAPRLALTPEAERIVSLLVTAAIPKRASATRPIRSAVRPHHEHLIDRPASIARSTGDAHARQRGGLVRVTSTIIYNLEALCAASIVLRLPELTRSHQCPIQGGGFSDRERVSA